MEAFEKDYREGTDRGQERMGGGGVYSFGCLGEKGHEAGSVFSDSGKASARGSVFGWQRLSLLRGSDQPLGDGRGGVAKMAARALWERGEGTRRA